MNPPSYILKFLWHHFEYNAVIDINYKTKEKEKKVSQMFDATLLPQIFLVLIIL